MKKFIGLDNKVYSMDTKPSSFPMRSAASCKSGVQYRCGQILKKWFPNQIILEELSIPQHRMYFDFAIPSLDIYVEVQGEQHFTHNTFFHTSVKDFNRSIDKDLDKTLLCQKNNWTLISVRSPEELNDFLESLDGND